MIIEELSTPDWRLILNKLLVGMPYDEVTFASYYLRDEKNFAKRVLEAQADKEVPGHFKGSKNRKRKLSAPQLPAEIALLKRTRKHY